MGNKELERMGTQGWQSFLASKHEMLYQYSLAKKYSKSHTVQTFHGNVAEAVFREWFTKFLPKRYAVTSGYVISQKEKDDKKMPHFDVIVYDQIESPILWHESNPDSSKMGICRAIPAEHVVSIFEVKSSFDPNTVDKAVKKLKEVEHLLIDIDSQKERYKGMLPHNFYSGMIFFELRKEHKYKVDSLKNILKAKNLRGYLGALILEGEELNIDKTGRIIVMEDESEFKAPIETTVSKSKFDLFGYPGEENESKEKLVESMKNRHPDVSYYLNYWNQKKDENGSYYGVDLSWRQNNFASFMFDLIASWNGTYKSGFISSQHCMSYTKFKKD